MPKSKSLYRCACCGRTTNDEPVIQCGIPDGDRDLVFSFCPRCWKQHKTQAPPIMLSELSAEMQATVLLSGVPTK